MFPKTVCTPEQHLIVDLKKKNQEHWKRERRKPFQINFLLNILMNSECPTSWLAGAQFDSRCVRVQQGYRLKNALYAHPSFSIVLVTGSIRYEPPFSDVGQNKRRKSQLQVLQLGKGCLGAICIDTSCVISIQADCLAAFHSKCACHHYGPPALRFWLPSNVHMLH